MIYVTRTLSTSTREKRRMKDQPQNYSSQDISFPFWRKKGHFWKECSEADRRERGTKSLVFRHAELELSIQTLEERSKFRPCVKAGDLNIAAGSTSNLDSDIRYFIKGSPLHCKLRVKSGKGWLTRTSHFMAKRVFRDLGKMRLSNKEWMKAEEWTWKEEKECFTCSRGILGTSTLDAALN